MRRANEKSTSPIFPDKLRHDLKGEPLNLYEWLDLNYLIFRTKDGFFDQDEIIRWGTSTRFRWLFAKAYQAYLRQHYAKPPANWFHSGSGKEADWYQFVYPGRALIQLFTMPLAKPNCMVCLQHGVFMLENFRLTIPLTSGRPVPVSDVSQKRPVDYAAALSVKSTHESTRIFRTSPGWTGQRAERTKGKTKA